MSARRTAADREPSRGARRAGTRGVPRSVREPLILDVAGQVFAADGYERASMDRIAALADLSKPMLYAYFGSKEGLYSAYIQRTGGELVQRLVAADRTGSRSDRIRAVTTEFLSFVQSQGDGWRVLFAEMTARRPLVELVARLRAQIVTEVRTMLEGGPQGRGSGRARLRGGRRGDRGGRGGPGQLVGGASRGPAAGRGRLVRGSDPGGDLRRGAGDPLRTGRA